jgi:hypothetical protein
MQPFVREARALVAAQEDITLEIDVCCMEILAAESADERASIRARLDALHRRSGVARVWPRRGPPRRALRGLPRRLLGVEHVARAERPHGAHGALGAPSAEPTWGSRG